MSHRRIGEDGEVKEDSTVRKWENLENDILVKIMQCFDIFELSSSGFAHVCSSWRKACCDPLIWKTLDLSMSKSEFIKLPMEPYVYVALRSDKTMTRLLKIFLSLSQGNITTLIFHFNLYLTDEQLAYIAERSPRLKRLVLPAWNRFKMTTICNAVHNWRDLESLTMPALEEPSYLIEEIANNCKNFSELKVMGIFEVLFASSLFEYLPKLRVLSLRFSALEKDALIHILENMQHLEVLNISHSLLIEVPPPPASPTPRRITRELVQSILDKASHLREFLTCLEDGCIMCERMMEDEGLMRWYRYEEGLWKEDEVGSLAL